MGRRRSVLRAVRFPQGDGAPVRPTFLPFRGGEVKRPLPSGEGGQGGGVGARPRPVQPVPNRSGARWG